MPRINPNYIFVITFSLITSSFKVTWSQINTSKIPHTQAAYFYASENFSQASQYFNLFDFYPSLESEVTVADFYKISTDLRLNRQGAEKKLAAFMIDNPTSYLTETAYYDLASYYFQNGKYNYALKWFNKIKATDVTSSRRNTYFFNKGYALFASKRFKQSAEYFEKVEDVPAYQADASYYLGYIAYQLDDFDAAAENFNKVSAAQDETTVGYFQADMNFKLGRFEKAIALARESLKTANENQTSELSKIIGESYFNLNDYNSALPYLEVYEGKKGKWSNTDFYQLGYTYYRLGEYDNAINQFNKIISSNNAVAQNAYYHLADCYLKTNKKTQALNAFKRASSMNFDSLISEDALLNYARLSYEIGNAYQNTSLLLASFIDQYPKNEVVEEIEQLLIDSYVNSRNYNAALMILKKKSGSQYSTALQKVNYLKAIALYKSGLFEDSIEYFNESLKSKKDQNIAANCLFWRAQADYELNDYSAVIAGLSEFEKHPFASKVSGFEHLSYHLGYANFKLKNYKASKVLFEQYLDQKNISSSYRRDALLRLGDSHFVLGKYWPAMEAYEKSIQLDFSKGVYALYQKALSYGFVDRNLKKIESLIQIVNDYPKSSLLDDVYFELGLAYTREKSDSSAIDTYNKLAAEYPKSPYRSRSLLNKGLILYNAESLDDALTVLKQLVQEYPNEEIAQQALKTAKEISIDLAEVDVFSDWVKQLKGVTLEDNELERASFTSAERLFNENKKSSAQKAFSSYLKNYPQGANQLQVKFLSAELYFQDEDWESAIERYQAVLDQSVSEYTEQSLVRITQSYVNGNQKLKALPFWKTLDELAQFQENKRYALFNLMQLYFEQENFKEAIFYADRVIELKQLGQKIKWDAYKVLARSSIAIKDKPRAAKAYQVLEDAPDSELAVEALFFDAQEKHMNHEYAASNEVIEKIAQDFGNYPEWASKSLLLMSQNFYQLDDAFQASYILESILTNFTQFPEIIKQATLDLENIKTIEAKNNSSIKLKSENEN
ncbi:tetratricopeptide repeat protein [Flavobacteriaceae bacterium]|nr:tetratricopeptide repeat protein [Flavobacteriaceae bacterium]